MADPETTVRRFLDAWDEPDLDRLVEVLCSYVTEDVVLCQMPFAEVTGYAGLRRICEESLATMSDFQLDLIDVSVVGNRVFTERVDRFVLHGRRLAVPVLGVFELSTDGRIVAWRDYFDPRPILSGLHRSSDER
jgi:limonene-1,2-epoxide hydrolase